jgi:hypothetical protein
VSAFFSAEWVSFLRQVKFLRFLLLPKLPEYSFHKSVRLNISREVKARIASLQIHERAFHPPPVAVIPPWQRLRIAVTGGAGFIGSHLVDHLLSQGHHVFVLDNMLSGSPENLARWAVHPYFRFILHDITEPISLEVDRIYHLACAATRSHHQAAPSPLLLPVHRFARLGNGSMRERLRPRRQRGQRARR